MATAKSITINHLERLKKDIKNTKSNDFHGLTKLGAKISILNSAIKIVDKSEVE